MSSLRTISPQTFFSLPNPKPKSLFNSPNSHGPKLHQTPISYRAKRKHNWVAVRSVAEELDVQSGDPTDQQEGLAASLDREADGELVSQVSGFATSEGQFSFEGFSSASPSGESENERMEKLIDRTINATIVLAAGSFAITKLLTIDQDYWHGWTIYEILRYAPRHNWAAYEEALKRNPVLAKMVISGVVYSIGDWIAQCCEGKPLFDFDRARMFRSGLVGFTFHGSLSHYYYQFCEELFPFQDWWVVPVKVAFDQTVWAAIWNSIYYVVLGFLRLESPISIFKELKAMFRPMLMAGWKLWPFAHLVTYGLVPVEQRLLWVDCVELIWVTILSTYSNEQSEARIAEMPVEDASNPPSLNPPED